MRGPPTRATLWPAREGLICRDPTSKQPLPETGRNLVLSPYWTRRMIDGDAVDVEPEWAKKIRLAAEKAAKSKGGDA